MRKETRVTLLSVVISILIAAMAQGALAQPLDAVIEIDATSGSLDSLFGHAFLCIRFPLTQGIKEDCYGFYPVASGVGEISGPGIVNAEPTKDHPDRFSKISASVVRAISNQQRRTLLQSIDSWNASRYALTSHNCIDFIDAAARVAGLITPDRTTFQLPNEYVAALAVLNP